MSLDWVEIIDLEAVLGWLVTNGVRILLIAVGALVVTRLASFIARRAEKAFDDNDPDHLSEREKQAATLGKVIRNIIRIVVWGIALMMVLREVGVEIAPILAGVGVAGLAVGVGAQSRVKDVLAGMFVLVENQYNVGDVVRLAGTSGLVEKVTLRATTLRDYEGRVHIVPNGVIDVVTNMTKEYSRFVLDIGVAYKEDVDGVMAVLKEIGDEMAGDDKFSRIITAPLEVLGVQDFGDSAVVIRVRFTTIPREQWAVGREFRRRVKKTFDAKGIEIPFPHVTVYLGEAAPMNGLVRVKVDSDEA